jgi:hypothetical protein
VFKNAVFGEKNCKEIRVEYIEIDENGKVIETVIFQK